MEIITITDEQLEGFIKEEKRDQESRTDRTDYTLDDVVMVRTTKWFPINGTIKTLEHSKVIEELRTSCFSRSIDDKDLEKPVFERFRSTIHFTLNGLVANHNTGNFSNRSIFIFDRLRNHELNGPSTIRCEDTIFDDDVELSKEAAIGITRRKYEELSEEEKLSLQRFGKVYVIDLTEGLKKKLYPEEDVEKYSPSAAEANRVFFLEQNLIDYILHDMNAPYFHLSTTYYVNEATSCNAQAMNKLIKQISEGYLNNQNSLSETAQKDEEIENKRVSISLVEHFAFVVENAVPVNEAQNDEFNQMLLKMNNYKDTLKETDSFSIDSYYVSSENGYFEMEDFRSDCKKFIGLIGLGQYRALTREFNVQKREQIMSKSTQK